MRFWERNDGTYTLEAPLTKEERDITACYTRIETGKWHYTKSNTDRLHWVTELPKNVQLQLLLLGEE